MDLSELKSKGNKGLPMWMQSDSQESAGSAAGEGTVVATDAQHTGYVEAGFGKAGPTWTGPTGTSFLPAETVERAKEGNPIEKAKLVKDPTAIFNDVYEFAAAIRSGEYDWKDIEKQDMSTRLKWVGLVHRDKRTPGRFMMRLRLPNGLITSELFRFFADTVEPYGPDLGVVDITTRQNIQLRGVQLQDADKIIDGLHARGTTSIQSALDNVRNVVGSPLAGIDDKEIVDTRDICKAINDLISVNQETGERGNPEWSNLPRKFNVAVSGSRDDYAHTHINDIGLQPVTNAETGEPGFNIVLGGYMSPKRVAESIDMNLWIPGTVEASVALVRAIIRIFRDEGTRKDRSKGRLMWLVESYGPVVEVDGHPRCDTSYRDAVVKEMESYGKDIKIYEQQPKASTAFERRSLLGVHEQPQEGKSRVGIHVPVGRLSVEECRHIAELADKYSAGEVRLTVEQNIILPNVDTADVDKLLAESVLQDGRLSVFPGNIVGNVVSCTGAQFCGLAIIETKAPAVEIARELDKRVEVASDLRIHFTGCPNSCGQVQAADIGLMGGPAKKANAEGVLKAVPGVNIFVGGKIGEEGHLSCTPYKKGVPLDSADLVPILTEIVVKEFGGKVKPEYAEEYAKNLCAVEG
jgi:ferredoxin-nitrite reductase